MQKIPIDNNVSKTNWKRILKLTLIWLAVTYGVFFVFAKIAASMISLEQEREWLGDFLQFPDAREFAPLQDIVGKIITPYGYDVWLVCEEEYNAYAGFGGNVYVTSGLLDQVESENELVMIIGHELGHVADQHVLESALHLLPFQGIQVITGIEIFTVLSGTIANVHSRSHELYADAYGLAVLEQVYGHVAGATDFLERDGIWEVIITFGSTHPISSRRIAQIEDIIQQQGYEEGYRTPVSDDLRRHGCE